MPEGPTSAQVENWREWESDHAMLLRDPRRHEPALWSATSPHGAVATPHYLATAAGARLLSQGGNAVDAAVAISLCLGVCEPAGSGLGGMTIMLVHQASTGRTRVIEGPCAAPRRADPEQVSRLANRNRGFQSIAVPMNPAVLGHAHARYGSASRDQVFAPAIRLAERGFPVPWTMHQQIARFRRPLKKRSAAAFFLDPAGRTLPAGHRMVQPVLAQTLERLARHGFEDFYVGDIGRAIVTHVQAGGGFLNADDMAEFSKPREIDPIQGRFHSSVIKTPGPPAGGLALLHLMQTATVLPMDIDPDQARGATLIAALIRQSRRDRRRFRLTTGDRQLEGAAEMLTSEFAKRSARKAIRRISASGETAHVSVVDAAGNAVSMTQSIERCFGSAEVTPSLGFLYNGYLRTFKVINKRHPHYLRPGAVARSNAAPTMVFRNGQLQSVIGSTGSERMVSGIFQVLLRMEKQSPFDAVHAPRLHCTPEGDVLLEAERFSEEVIAALTSSGFNIQRLDRYSFQVGGLQLVSRTSEGWCGVADPRRDGAAIGIDR